MADALNVLNAKALFEGKKQAIFTRIVEKDNAIYIDLCSERWESVRVDADGWEIVSNPPVKFKRSRIAEEIPKINDLRRLETIFIRKLIGLDVNAAKEVFSEFTKGKTLSANQMDFINSIIDFFVNDV